MYRLEAIQNACLDILDSFIDKRHLYKLLLSLFLIPTLSGLSVSNVQAGNTDCVIDSTVATQLTPRALPPCDYNGAVDREGIYRFSWNTFFALSWPAKAQQADGSHRGIPDITAPYGAADRVPVWDTWRSKRELFRPTLQFAWDVNSPGVFSAYPPTADPNPNIVACAGVKEQQGLQIMQANKVDNYVDETDEIALTVLWSQTDPVSGSPANLPTESTLVRYQVKFSEDHWNYVTGTEIFGTAALNKLVADTSNSMLGGVSFPAGSNANEVTGSILTKSAWKMVSAAEAASGDYFTVDAYYYVPTQSDATEVCYKPATFALIGLHIIRKTESFPTFFFSTFEHKGNYPGQFYYANTNGGTPHASTLPSGYGIPYKNPADPQFNVQADLSSYQANRLVPESVFLAVVNGEADGVNSGSVWSNYRLVGAQYRPVNGINGNVDPDPNQDFFLANPVVETNQRFQYFDGRFGQAGKANVELNPSTSKAGTVNMGGCMGCHGNVQLSGTDFSFTLSNVQSPPEETSAAETLADKCQEVGLVISADGLSCVVN